jgi:hypothetical protein
MAGDLPLASSRYEEYRQALADDGAFHKRYMLLPFEVTDARGRKTIATVEGDEGVFVTTQAKARDLSRNADLEVQLLSYGQGRTKKGFMAKATAPAARD